jgi:hypothetical protein
MFRKLRSIATLMLCAVSASAAAMDRGQFKDVPPEIREWFENMRSPKGISCCSYADGHRTGYDIRQGQYWVPIDGDWYPVPPEAVIKTENPVGEAIVWYLLKAGPEGDSYRIICFVPSGDVWFPLPLRALTALGQGQKSECASGEARGGGGLGAMSKKAMAYWERRRRYLSGEIVKTSKLRSMTPAGERLLRDCLKTLRELVTMTRKMAKSIPAEDWELKIARPPLPAAVVCWGTCEVERIGAAVVS